jgi:cation diffusion facilitator CzcD-associated flavoprotein CzcO
MSGQRQTIIVGAGPAGLAVGAALRRKGIPFAILERSDRVGSSWHGHYERLHLHTPASHSALPFMAYPRDCLRYPSRLEVIDYLEQYAHSFDLQPEYGVNVTRCRRSVDGWTIETASGDTRSGRDLVVASGLNRIPVIPRWPGQESFAGPVIHSSAYRTGAAFHNQRVLVVGFGNSGAEIAIDLYEHGARPSIAVRSSVNVVPREVLGVPITRIALAARVLPRRIVDAASALATRFVLGDLARAGIPLRPDSALAGIEQRRRIPVIDVGTVGLIRCGAIRLRVALERFDGRQCVFADGSREAYDAVILATGYAAGLTTMFADDSAILDDFGHPRSHGAAAAPGLYFCGFRVVPTGLLRELGREALEITDEIAGQGCAWRHD